VITDRKYDVMQGYEFSYLPCLVLGAKGYIGVSFSLCAPVYVRLDKAFREGDFDTAQRLQLAVSDFLTTVLAYSMIPAVKTLMKEVSSPLPIAPVPTASTHCRSCDACGRACVVG
jgi:N-acetylneuraminate lyase